MTAAPADHPGPRRGSPTWSGPIRRRRRPDPAARPLADRRRRLDSDATPATCSAASPPSCPSCEVLQRAADGPRAGERPAGPRRRGARLQLGRWQRVDEDDFTHLGKLDADIELPPDYFERLLARFADEPVLGIAGGDLLERGPRRLAADQGPGLPRARRAQALQPRVLRSDRRESRSALAGTRSTRPTPACGAIATRSLRRSGRPPPPSGGDRAAARCAAAPVTAQCAYILRYGGGWVLLRSLKVAGSRPLRPLGARLPLRLPAGSALRRAPRVEDERLPPLRRSELRARMRPAPSRLLRTRSGAPERRKFARFSCVPTFESQRATPSRKPVREAWTPGHRKRALATQDLPDDRPRRRCVRRDPQQPTR